MSREKLKDFLSQMGSTESSISYVVNDLDGNGIIGAGDDLGVDPGTGEPLLDLQTDSTGLLGDYLKFIVDLARPEAPFKIKKGNVESASSNRGDVLVPAEDQGAESPFVKQGTTLGSEMSRYSNSGQFDNTTNSLHQILDKTGLEGDSHRLLSDIEGRSLSNSGITFPISDPPATAVEESVNQVLGFKNRFSSDVADSKAFTPQFDDSSMSATDIDAGYNQAGTTTSQNEFGQYDKNAVQMIQNNLKKVGASLMLKAAGWDRESVPGESPDPDNLDRDFFLDDNNDDNAISPRLIDPVILSAKSAKGGPEISEGGFAGFSTRMGRGDFLSHDDITNASRSHGATYTADNMFDARGSQKIIRAQAAAAIVALMEASKVMLGLIGDIISDNQPMSPGPYLLGKGPNVALDAKFDLLKRLVIVPTEHPYDICVNRGIRVLFTDDSSPIKSGELGSSKDVVINSQHINEAPGFWLAIARSVLRAAKDISDIATLSESGLSKMTISDNQSFITSLFMLLSQNRLIRFLNVAATIGDVSFKMTGGNINFESTSDVVGPWNVDRLADGPATRISKSRSGDGTTSMSLAWRGNSVPAIYLVPKNIIRTSIQLGTLGIGTNPLKGIMGSTLIQKAYLDKNMDGSDARIRSDIVERLENLLDAEYVPFYFHDLRTNEIITFHAFLDSLSDNYTPSYAGDASGYGRMDSVKMYSGTKRRIGLTFYAVSTSKQDFNEMWWKINKLVTLIYPQWTQGDKVSVGDDSSFIMPFSQVMGASPIIRLRVGDVIKSNYSKFHLARMFGIGDEGISPKIQEEGETPATEVVGNAAAKVAEEAEFTMLENIFYSLFGSPLQLLKGSGTGDRIKRSLASLVLTNGFANPLGLQLVMARLRDPDSIRNTAEFNLTAAGSVQALASGLASDAADAGLFGYRKLEVHYLKASMGAGYVLGEESKTKYRVVRPLRVMIMGKLSIKSAGVPLTLPVNKPGSNRTFRGPRLSGTPVTKTQYSVMIVDPAAPFSMLGKTLTVSHADIMPNPNLLFNTSALPSISLVGTAGALVETVAKEIAVAAGIPADTIDDKYKKLPAAKFMNSENNPIVKSFNSSRGRGLAGAITQLSFNWLEFPWEIDWNSRAPIACKVQIGFDVIHDLPPGIDHAGFNRAPIYNVGDVMEYVAGDPYDDNGMASKSRYTSEGRLGYTSPNVDPESNIED